MQQVQYVTDQVWVLTFEAIEHQIDSVNVQLKHAKINDKKNKVSLTLFSQQINFEFPSLPKIMNTKGYRCSLHQQPFQFFCQRCLQPVCKQCTIIGPHHTQIHVMSKINIAYERKVEQIRNRIHQLIENNREKLNFDIQQIQLLKTSVDTQNNKEKQRMILTLIKQYENNRNSLHLFRENLTSRSNEINDLGFKYKTIENPIELLGSHQKILHQLKELHDRMQLTLQKNIPLTPYTKELTDMRIDLKQIECLNEFYEEKIKTITLIIRKTNSLSLDINAPKIDYQSLLIELNKNLGSIKHLICHFCGLVFSFDEANNQCQKNAGTFSFSYGEPLLSTAGLCKVSIDTNKLGTHRHFFGEPSNPMALYGPNAMGSFKLEQESIFLKAKALIQQKQIKIAKEFQKNDKNNQGFSEIIVFDYIFIEMLGMTEKQKLIITSISQPLETNPSFLSYKQILQELNKIDI